jgi:hypothetical protein
MALLPVDTVRAYVTAEMAAARAWAARHDHTLSFDEAPLTLTMPLLGPARDGDGTERYLLTGTFEDYRALPPRWWFVHPDTGADIGPAAYPAQPAPHPRGSGLFIGTANSGAGICAHFNRLAYFEDLEDGQQHTGIHSDWGQPANWLNLPPDQYTRATTIADMLARIELEVNDSAGRMAPLP